MSSITKSNRRTFLKLGLGGLATGAVAPWVWTPRLSDAYRRLLNGPNSR